MIVRENDDGRKRWMETVHNGRAGPGWLRELATDNRSW